MREALQSPPTQTDLPVVQAGFLPGIFQKEVSGMLEFLLELDTSVPGAFGAIEARFESLARTTRLLEADGSLTQPELRSLQHWFRDRTDPVFSVSRLMKRIRTWPEGHPGDYLTLEAVYADQPGGTGLAALLDRYLLTRTLAVAVRSRLRKLAALLDDRSKEETHGGNWLNIACGSCRELLSLPAPAAGRRITALDSDHNALAYAARLIEGVPAGETTFLAENAMRLVSSRRTRERFGEFSTIYSAGFFDYVRTEPLSALLRALHASLAPGGVLIAPFKDAQRYATFDYHWVARWDAFLQRTESDCRRIFESAGIPRESIEMQRDETGVILFFLVRK